MKSIFIIFIVFLMMFMTACENSDKADKKPLTSKTTTSESLTTTKKSDDLQYLGEDSTDPCPQFVMDGIVHNGTVGSLLYDGALRLFDYSLLDGYIFKGIIYNDNDTVYNPTVEFQSNYDNGTPVLYNADKNSYIMWTQTDRAWLKVTEHICNNDLCKSVTE